jgi:uncharacterized surface anchored protein
VQIKKIGENDNPLSGVVLGVYSTEDNLIEKLTTDENGSAISKELFYGDYYIKEIQPLEGYVLDETKHSFSIVDNDETVNIDISNKWIRGEVEVVLTDSETDEPLKCAVFGIYTMDDELIDEITIDDNGYVLSNNLIYGEYYVKEMKSPVGYNLDKDKYPFTVDTNEKIIHLDVKNSIIKGGVQITNTSASDGAFIQGSVFELYDKDGRIIKELTTDNKGKITLSDLKYGEYYLQETSVPYGYVLDNIKHPFNIREDNKTINISILNHPIVGSVEVYFKDIKHGHEISKPYSYTDWIGRDYMPWVMGNGLDKKNIDGYKLVKADYPDEKELIDDKLIITYWYDGL